MRELITRYIDLLGGISSYNGQGPDKTSNPHLCWMLTHILTMDVTDTKAHRWLGFVQGVMAVKGLIDVDTERELVRVLLN